MVTIQSPDHFIVVHYTGEQTYHLEESWVRINHAHPPPRDVVTLLEHSAHPTVQGIAKVCLCVCACMCMCLCACVCMCNVYGCVYLIVASLPQTMLSSPDAMLGECVSSSCLSRRVRISLDILEEHITSSSPYFIYCLSGCEVYVLTLKSSYPPLFPPTPGSSYPWLLPPLAPPTPGSTHSQDTGTLLQQIQYYQLVDIALMQSTGYPVHVDIEGFVDRYGSPLLSEGSLPMTADTCTRILKSTDLDNWCVGRTQVFLKPWHVPQLEERLNILNRSAQTVQNGVYLLYPTPQF